MTQMIILVAALLVAAMVFAIFMGVDRMLDKNTGYDDFRERLRSSTISEFNEDKDEIQLNSWNKRWYDANIKAGKIPDDPEAPGRLITIILFAGFFGGFFIWPGGVLGGIVFPASIIGGYVLVLSSSARKRINQIDKQLPLMISHLRANLQSGSTAQQALIGITDDIPSPLGTELKVLRDQVNVNVSLSEALNDLSNRVPSREMKFLTSSIEIATSSGADLEPQLKIIQGILHQRRKQAQLLATAVSSVAPSLWVAGGAVPVALLWSLNSSPENKEFWQSPIGLAALVVVIFLYGTGLFVNKKMVRNIENT